MKKIKNADKQTALDKIKDLMNERSDYAERDRIDLDTARSVLSGFGFDEDDRKYRGNKPEITIPVINQWINEVATAYERNPFSIELKGNRDLAAYRYIFDKLNSKILQLSNKALIDSISVGYTYGLVSTNVVDVMQNWQDIDIQLIDPRKVIVGYCEEADLSDCDTAIVIDILDKEKAKAKFELDDYDLRGSRDVLYGYDIVMDSKTQVSVITLYERISEGVRVSKVVYNKVIDQVVIPIKRLPLVRFYGDSCYIDKKEHYRGVYQLISDLWKLVNFGASEIQARIATAPTANFIGDPAAIAADPEAYEIGSDRNFLPSKSWQGNEQLGQVQQISKNLEISELQNTVTAFMASITQMLGSVSVESRANETAEAILARRSSAEATINKYVTNLRSSLIAFGTVILEHISVYYDSPREVDGYIIPSLSNIEGIDVVIKQGPIEASRRQADLQQMLAFYSLAKESNPNAFGIVGPVILSQADLPDDVKRSIMPLFAQNNSAQQITAQTQQIAQLQQQLAAQAQQIAALNQDKSALQIQLNEFVDDSEIKLRIAQMDNETKIYLKRLELAANNEELIAKLQAEYNALQTKMQNDLIKQRMKLQSIPEVPVFNRNRFV